MLRSAVPRKATKCKATKRKAMPAAAGARGAPSAGQLRALGARDPQLARALRAVEPYPGFPGPDARRLSSYGYLARAICFQQLTGKAAGTIWRRLCALGERGRPPEPATLLALGDEALRGLSRQKVASLRDLAERVADGRLVTRGLARADDAEVVARLTEVRGIGAWSAQMFLLFKLGRLDVLAPGDLGLQEGLRRLDGLAERPGPKELEQRARVWAPLRSVASWTLWRLTELDDWA
jgi:DNA-3-methyladenine glycosylase II